MEEKEIILNSQNEEEGSEKGQVIASGMVYVWEQVVEQKIILDPQLAQKLVKSYHENFKSSLDLWKNYCKTIASSKFLMGEVPNTKFEIKLSWALRKEAIEKILCGHFS